MGDCCLWPREQFVSLIMARTSDFFDEMRSALYYTSTLGLIVIVLTPWNNGPYVDMLLHSDTCTLFRFRDNQSLLLLLIVVYLAEKQKILILVFGSTQPGIEPTICGTPGEHDKHYTTDAVEFYEKGSNHYDYAEFKRTNNPVCC